MQLISFSWILLTNILCYYVIIGVAFLISAVSAIRNDMYYPDAQMTPKEATNFINHLKVNIMNVELFRFQPYKSQIIFCKLDLNYHHPLLQSTNPEMNIILKSHVRLTDHGHQLYDGSTGRRVDISYVGYGGTDTDWQRPKKAFEPSNWYDWDSMV